MANLPTRNNNPGDLRDPSTGGFQQFSSPQEGYAALLNDLHAKQVGTTTTGLGPSSSLADFAKVYAPPGDNNDSAKYAADLANQMGVSPDTQLSQLDLGKWADAVSHNEGYQGSQQTQQTTGFNPKPFSNAEPGQFDFSGQAPQQDTSSESQPDTSTLGGQIKSRLGQASTALGQAASGEINPVSGVLQTAGAAGGFVGDVTGDVLGLIPGVKQAEGLIGQGVKSVAQTAPAQAVLQKYESWAQQHPELANDVGAVGNIATALPILRGFGVAKDVAGSVLKTALTGSSDAVLDTVSPSLTGKALAKAIETQGTSNKGLIGKTVLNPSVQDQAVADAVKANVPKFNPSRSLTYNIAATKNVANQMASDLIDKVNQAGANRIYSFKELNSYLDALPKPTLLVGNDMETLYGRVKDKAMEFARQNGGKVTDLLQTRKDFDRFVSQEFPNLYTSDTLTPMRTAIKNIRNGLTKFTAANLPEGTGLQESLLTQHKLLTAVENMSSKAAKGSSKEIGSTAISRLAKKHPVATGLLRTAGKAAATGLGVRGAEDLIP